MGSHLKIFLGIGLLLGLTSAQDAFANNRHCFCQAMTAGGDLLYDYGAIDNYGILETDVDDKCRVSCVGTIQHEIVERPTWGGDVWKDATSVCAWTGGVPKAIKSHSKVATGSWTTVSAIDFTYDCYGEPCPSADLFASQTQFGPYIPAGQPPLSTYNDYAVMIKNGDNPDVGVVDTLTGQFRPSCSASIKANNKCLYYRVQSGGDQCLGLNPPAYTPGATPSIDDTETASCPPAKKPTYTFKEIDDTLSYFGMTVPSNLDNCRAP